MENVWKTQGRTFIIFILVPEEDCIEVSMLGEVEWGDPGGYLKFLRGFSVEVCAKSELNKHH